MRAIASSSAPSVPEYAGSQRSAFADVFDSRGSMQISVPPFDLRLDDPLRVRIEVVPGLEVRREQQDRLRVGVIGRRPVGAAPEEVPEPRRRGADVRVAVVAVDAPRLQHAVGVAVFAGTADVIHQLVPAVLDDRLADPPADVVERLVPRHLLPAPLAALAGAPQRVEDAVGIVELVRRDDPLRARAAAAAGVQRVALDLADVERLLVDVGEDAAGRFAVEADARDDPVAPPVLLRPAGRLEVDVVVPLRRVGMRAEASQTCADASQCAIAECELTAMCDLRRDDSLHIAVALRTQTSRHSTSTS